MDEGALGPGGENAHAGDDHAPPIAIREWVHWGFSLCKGFLQK